MRHSPESELSQFQKSVLIVMVVPVTSCRRMVHPAYNIT